MTGRRITAGLLMLCALVFCAFAASSASAAGTTYFTCVEGGGAKDFTDADCATPGAGNFGHVAIAAKKSTKVSLTQTATSKLMGTVGGLTTTLTATGFTSSGATVENSERATKEMAATGSGAGTYTGVTVSEGPPGCKVKGGTVSQLSTVSESVPASMEIEFKPTATNFAEFELEGCTTKGLNTKYKVSGTAKGIPRGAFLDFTEASTSGLKLAGQAAFFESTITVKNSEAGGNPITTTTTTP